jgi:hypothetical protein
VDTAAFAVQATWDARHVWAPSIVPYGGRTYMFYAGVGADGNQRIGYASTGRLDTTDTAWARESTWVFSADSTAWADRVGHVEPGVQQFRDPFVFPDPDSTGRFLMLYAAENKYEIPSGHNAVGLARNLPGTLSRWQDLGYYRRTDYAHTYVTDVESPHAFLSGAGPSQWQLMFTSGFGAPNQSIVFELGTSGMAVSDTTITGWSFRTPLYWYLGNDSTVYDWRATEHLTAGGEEFLAGYDDRGIGIARLEWAGATFVLKPPAVTAVAAGERRENGPRLVVADLPRGTPRIVLRVELPAGMPCTLAVYDVMGRRTRTLLEGEVPEGRTSVTWDCRDTSGAQVPSGDYLARLICRAGTCVVRLPVLR